MALVKTDRRTVVLSLLLKENPLSLISPSPLTASQPRVTKLWLMARILLVSEVSWLLKVTMLIHLLLSKKESL